jgi:outer membrane receptor for ferrienterochelin and colicins
MRLEPAKPGGLGLLTCALMCGAAPAVHAQATPPTSAVKLPPELTQEPGQDAESPEAAAIQRIVNSLVLSPSNREENALLAPAWVITFTRKDLEQRGYKELTDLLDDLPSMEVARAHGDSYFKSYWRGYRGTLGAPYLLLVDGLVFNHLWINEAEIMAAIPLSQIKRVEISYGPASAVYGANASAGVINIITETDREETGVDARARFFLETPQSSFGNFTDMSKVADGYALYKGTSLRLMVSGRMDFSVLDPGLADAYEYTRNRYYTDRRLYGDFLDSPELAGAFRSESRKQAFDARLILFDNTDVGVQLYRMRNGEGVSYAADRAPTRIPFTTLERSYYARHRFQLGERFASTTLLRYRASNIDSPTTWLEFEHSSQQVTFQYWQSKNYSYTASQEVSLGLGSLRREGDDDLKLDFGFKYERKDLERDYVKTGDDSYWDPAQPFDQGPGRPSYEFPEPPSPDRQIENRDQLDTVGAYALARYQVVQGHIVNVGFRVDYNSFFGQVSPIFRGGYVGQFFQDFTVKLLYGQAIQEPTWRELFGTFIATGSNPNLKRERSQTFELSLAYTIEWLALQGNLYLVDYTNAIIAIPGTAINLGRRLAVGADLSGVVLISVPGLQQVKLWGSYSPYFIAKETEFPDPEGDGNMVDVGDLSAHKFRLGLTVEVNSLFDATALARCFTDRTTVASNPIRSVPGYCTVDLNTRAHFFDGQVSLDLRITNLLGTQYFHPGILDADSGEEPGRWVDDRWVGSAGYFNSKLPQPGRAFMLALDFNF